MAARTKMIIITSNEDIVRQYSLNKTKNRQIIDSNKNKQITSIENDKNNIMDFDLLAELSQLVRIKFQ
jgi:hypothetical protein